MGRYDITVKYFAAKYPQAYIRLALGAVLGQVLSRCLNALSQLNDDSLIVHVDFVARDR
jgi:hypothetical protein